VCRDLHSITDYLYRPRIQLNGWTFVEYIRTLCIMLTVWITECLFRAITFTDIDFFHSMLATGIWPWFWVSSTKLLLYRWHFVPATTENIMRQFKIADISFLEDMLGGCQTLSPLLLTVSTNSEFAFEVLANKTAWRYCPPFEMGRTNSVTVYDHGCGSHWNAVSSIRTLKILYIVQISLLLGVYKVNRLPSYHENM
jgi:hypothetical protein